MVNLFDYIEDHLSPYYDSIEEVREMYGENNADFMVPNWVIAECIFEQTCGLY